MDPVQLLDLFERMTLIRRFEQRVSQLYRDGEIPGFVHLAVGQEACAVGACMPLSPEDVITSTHRGHGHCLAKGLDPEPMFAELLARETGVCGGRGGSMHIADPSLGIFGANGIVSAGLPIAAGAALAAQLRRKGSVVVAMFGDGAVAQGAFHEAVNLAAVWSLPVVFFCENNHYAEFSSEADQHPAALAARAAGYGLAHHGVDGNDVEAVAAVMSQLVVELRAGGPPVMVEADTYRWHGHYEGDPERYRSVEATEEQKQNDPLLRTRRQLVARGVSEADIAEREAHVDRRLDQALAAARAAPPPPDSTVLHHVRTPVTPPPEPPTPTGEEYRVMDAVRSALEYELQHDDDVVLAGVDVGASGNVFGLTRGLQERWPERVRDTPISETAVMGVAVGASMAGLRPVVELMYVDFVGVCFDQLLNQAAKLRFMTGGHAQLPMVVRTQFGAGRSSGSQHSQSLEALLAHVPGLTVVMPSTPADTYGLLRAAIRDPNPVVFIENRLLYGRKGPRPSPEHLIPLGKAAVVRPGRDVTVVSMSRLVLETLAVADELAAGAGVDAEVIDLRTIAPLDTDTVLRSVERTGRLLVVHEAVRDFGIGAEIAATVAERAFWHLDAPVARLGGLPSPVPYAPNLERAWLPSRDAIRAAIMEMAHV